MKIFYQVTNNHLFDVKGYNIIMKPIENDKFQPVIIDYGKVKSDEDTDKYRGIRDLSSTLLIFFEKNLIDYGLNLDVNRNLKNLLIDISDEKNDYDYDDVITELENITDL